VEHGGKHELVEMRKPLKELRLATFSAHVETVTTKPFFREPFKKKRCRTVSRDGHAVTVRILLKIRKRGGHCLRRSSLRHSASGAAGGLNAGGADEAVSGG
jgi:hypothetical protein